MEKHREETEHLRGGEEADTVGREVGSGAEDGPGLLEQILRWGRWWSRSESGIESAEDAAERAGSSKNRTIV